MLILGLLLVVISGAAAVVLIAYNGGGTAQTVTAFGRDIVDVTLMQAFVAGIVVALLFLLGLAMVLMAGRRGRENRARYKEARREAKAAAAERDELAERLRHDEHRAPDHAEQTTVTQPVQNQPSQPVQNQPPSQQYGAPAPPPDNRGDNPNDPNNPNNPTDNPRARHAAQDQPVITNVRPGQSPSR